MKNLGLFCLLLTCIGLESCKKDQNPNDGKATSVPAEKSVSVTCYKALYEKDTIELKMNTLKDGKITGNMEMKVFNRPKRVGEIAGEFHGDTLFVDYSFIQGTNENRTFKNPMAMLKRGDTLILGNGKIETYLGRSYFAKGTPIDFDSVKYKFSSVDCVDK